MRLRTRVSPLPRRAVFAILILALCGLAGAAEVRRVPLQLTGDDVLPTGNEWISLPDIRASDGALMSFNAISMRHRGLLQVNGADGQPVLQPYFTIGSKHIEFRNPAWNVAEYWIPSGRAQADGIEMTITYCAPPGSRAAVLQLTMKNTRSQPVEATLGVRASWGNLSRVTYVPVILRGERVVGIAPWVSPGEVFSFITSDTEFAWALIHPGSTAEMTSPPLGPAPASDARRTVTLKPGETAESLFILAPGVEEFSAAHNARALRELLDREGFSHVLDDTAAWCAMRTRSTGQPDLDLLMNRNFLFTELFAWGKTIDTEQTVGMTSRGPRYYVSAAYWDRDAMLWSFPALLDSDPALAREALEYAFGTQLRNAGTHSRFIDGVVLEDGFQLDEAVAPLIALADYVKQTSDVEFARRHRDGIDLLRDRLLSRFDPSISLYSSLQDSQDEFQKLPFLTYDNALTWRALLGMADLYSQLGDKAESDQMRERANQLHVAVLSHCISSAAPGAGDPIFASATDGKNFVFTEIPPGSLIKLPLIGFISEDDPVFERTYAWLHSKNYKYSNADLPFGFPGSYRVDFTTSWSVAEHLQLKAGREKALQALRASNWDGGIITEGINPATGKMDLAGRAFATAAGYVAHAICATYCTDRK